MYQERASWSKSPARAAANPAELPFGTSRHLLGDSRRKNKAKLRRYNVAKRRLDERVPTA